MAMEISADFEKADILGVVFEPGSQLYMRYVEILVQTHNDVDRTFYDAINSRFPAFLSAGYCIRLVSQEAGSPSDDPPSC
jgi:hypothetical protein